MRGKVFTIDRDCPLMRITPAYAGKSSAGQALNSWLRDHPRVCGEKPPRETFGRTLIGSPPRMRGKVNLDNLTHTEERITPAYAGKSWCRLASRVVYQDHPRVCGEKLSAEYRMWTLAGSPPRMRGKVQPLQRCSLGAGITPAYAGKRLKRSRSTVSPVAIVPLVPSVCNKPVVSDGNPAEHDAPLFLPAENAAPASPAYNLRSL